MKTCMDNVIYRAISNNEYSNALYLPYDGLFESMICQVENLQFYSLQKSLVYEWPCNFWPNSLHKIPNVNYIPNRLDLDLIISNWRQDQALEAQKIADTFHLPHIIIDHELPNTIANTNLKKFVNSQLPQKATYVSIHDLINEEWQYNDNMNVTTIPYGFKVVQSPLRSLDVLVVGDYNIRDKNILNEMMSSHHNIKGLGYNDNTDHYQNVDNILLAMSQAKICVMATQPTRHPTLALAAASCGCAIVTNKTKWTSRIFEHEKNGMLFDDLHKIKKYIKYLVANEDIIKNMGHANIKMIEENYNIDDFCDKWSNLINNVKKEVYTR